MIYFISFLLAAVLFLVLYIEFKHKNIYRFQDTIAELVNTEIEYIKNEIKRIKNEKRKK